MMEQCNNKSDDGLRNVPNGNNTKLAIIAVVTDALIPIAFVAFCVCAVPVFANKAHQSNIVPHGNVLLLFNISRVLIEHIYICLALLYILLTLDAVVYLVLFRMRKRIWASLWSWLVIISESAAMFFSVFILYDYLELLIR